MKQEEETKQEKQKKKHVDPSICAGIIFTLISTVATLGIMYIH